MNHPEDVHSNRRKSPGPNPRRPGRRAPRNPTAEKAAAAFSGLPEGRSHLEIGELLRIAGVRLGFKPAQILYFDALLQETEPQDWWPGARPIVWLQVQDIAYQLRISTSVVRSNERKLHQLGAITWKDSTTGNRFGQRDRNGKIVVAFGVDLSPSAMLLPRLHQIATDIRPPEMLQELLERAQRRTPHSHRLAHGNRAP